MNKLNYTDYLALMKLKEYKIKDLLQVIQDKKQEVLNSETSVWGLTDSKKEYIKVLDLISDLNDRFFKRLGFKKIYKELDKNFDKKIKVVFFCQEYSTFLSYKSLYDKMKKSEKFICSLVHIPFFHVDKASNEKDEIDEYKRNGYDEIISHDSFKLNEMSPDIAFYLKPYDLIPKEFYIDEIEKVIDKVIYIPYGMEIGAAQESIRYQFQLPLHEKAWKCISYCDEHYSRACKYSLTKGKNFVQIGHPRFDLSQLDLTNNENYIDIKKKAGNRKIVLYNPHFTIEDGDTWGAFKQFGMEILRYFKEHNDMVLLYRPHPFFKEAFLKEYANDKKTVDEYNDIVNNSDNIIYDKSQDYLVSVHVSDFMISDASSLIPEYLIYNKPIIYTKKKNASGLNNKKMQDLLYSCDTIDDVIKYVELLKDGIDDLREKREIGINSIFNYDKEKQVSDKIIDMILSEFN